MVWFYFKESKKITKLTSGEELTRLHHRERELAAGFSLHNLKAALPAIYIQFLGRRQH